MRQRIEPSFGVADEQFRRTVSSLLRPPLLEGNRVEGLANGVRIFPAMLEAIRGAERTICFETYIYWEGRIGREFAEALAARARAGVRVHLLLDWVGTQRMDHASLELMRRSGAEIRYYRPLRWHDLDKVNHRTHRKLLVVDGRLGFTGGVGIADVWLGDARSPEEWRDMHYRVEGPVVAQMQAAFMDNWMHTAGAVLVGEDYFPPLEPRGDMLAQISTSSPADTAGAESARLLYLYSVEAARNSILLASAYFVPDSLAVDTLVAARRRGVAIRILVPGPHIDFEITRRASRALWGRLLEAGIEIREYQPTMFHVKMMIVDRVWTLLGSTNFDNRSFRLNDEANLNVWNAAFAAGQTEIFLRDLENGEPVTLEAWRRRPLREKLLESGAALFRKQL